MDLTVFIIVSFIIGLAGMLAVVGGTALVAKHWGRKKARIFFLTASVIDLTLFILLTDHLSLKLLGV